MEIADRKMDRDITGRSTVVATREQVSSELSSEAAILNLKNGTYYGLNVVGARIWNLIREPIAVNAIFDILTKEYSVDRAECERQVLTLLKQLAAEGLVEVSDEPATQVP